MLGEEGCLRHGTGGRGRGGSGGHDCFCVVLLLKFVFLQVLKNCKCSELLLVIS